MIHEVDHPRTSHLRQDGLSLLIKKFVGNDAEWIDYGELNVYRQEMICQGKPTGNSK